MEVSQTFRGTAAGGETPPLQKLVFCLGGRIWNPPLRWLCLFGNSFVLGWCAQRFVSAYQLPRRGSARTMPVTNECRKALGCRIPAAARQAYFIRRGRATGIEIPPEDFFGGFFGLRRGGWRSRVCAESSNTRPRGVLCTLRAGFGDRKRKNKRNPA